MKAIVPALLASSLCLMSLPVIAQTQTPYQIAFWGQPAAQTSTKLEYTHFVLPNGLNVYLNRNPLEPRFYAQVVVNAGGKNDPADATGIAHYLEHMLFKGTDELGTRDFAAEKVLQDKIVAAYDQLFSETDPAKRTALHKEINQLSIQASNFAIPGELDSLYGRLGAEGLNAYTSNEETVYLVSMPKNRIEQWAKVESERFKDPVFRLFQSELETVYEEKNISLDDKDDILWEAVEAQLYKKHPYGTQTILGSVDHLKNPSLNKMYAFYRKNYVPNNMAVVISGDIDIAQTKAVIEKYFGTWERKENPVFTPPVEPALKGIERVQVKYKGEEKVMLAFRTVPFKHPDKPALQMVDMLLDAGKTGLIKLNLVQTQKVREAGSSQRFLKDYGAEYLYAIPREGQSLQDAEKLLLDQIEALKQGQFDESMIQAVAQDYEIAQKRSLEGNQARAALMSEAFLHGMSVEELMSYPAKLKVLSKQQVMDAARKYFGSDYVVGQRVDQDYQFPAIEKPQLEKVNLNPNQKSPFVKAVEDIQAPPVEPVWIDTKSSFQARSFAPGSVFHYTQNPLNDLFNFQISYDYGDKHYPNFCLVMSELNNAGTAQLNAPELANQFYKLGVQSNFNCSQYSFSMSLSGPDSSFESALKLSEELLWSAKLDPVRFGAKIENAISQRKDAKNDLATLRQALRAWVRYDSESGFLDRPSADELKKVDVNEYPAMTQALKKQNFDVYYTGQLPSQQVEDLVHKYHQPQSIPVPLLNPRKAPPFKVQKRTDKGVQIYYLHYPGAQANIDMVIPGGQVDPRQALLTEYYNQYMDGGMGAIMFQEVRESRALAYSTWSYYFQGGRLGDQDQMLAFIGTQADKTPEALALLIELMRKPPVSESHFQRAKQALDNQYRSSRINFRDIVGTVQSWGELGFDQDPRPAYFSQLEKIQLKDVLDYLNQKVASQPLTFTIVGDRDKVNLPALKKLGDVQEMQVGQLFRD